MSKRIVLVTCIAGLGTIAPSGPSSAQSAWSDYSAAAAIAYCMAVHPNRSPAGAYTNGFEHMAPPGIAGAVRRNFVYGRVAQPLPKQDVAIKQTCDNACSEWGKASSGRGRALHTGTAKNSIPSGIGDIAATALKDWDFPSGPPVVAGFVGRPQNYHMHDVAQADFCCCHLVQ